ncbi:MAG: LacI family transcriptional regulator [Candidatus Dormibacteraeota bacterium]|nr:LacI family transcriptional regulator [Candidatus Dormibacteraeota bacterium]
MARRAGLSKSLVSRVLRGEPAVSPTAREAVLAAAVELGYRPNAVARSLVQRRTFNVGVLVSDLHNLFFAEVLDGLDSAASARGYRMLITTGNRDPEAEARALEQLVELRADAVVLAGARLAAERVTAILGAVPAAVVGCDLALAGLDVVVTDDVRGAELAVEHLAGLGHRLIAMIDGDGGAGAAERQAGYESAMTRLGLTAEVRVVPGDFTEQGGREGVLRLLAGGRQPGVPPRAMPTAVLAANDLAAIGALAALAEAGLDVPGDISLVGYDNTSLAALRPIALTTVHQPRREIGELAMTALLQRLEKPGTLPCHRLLAPELVVRATTGPPPPSH